MRIKKASPDTEIRLGGEVKPARFHPAPATVDVRAIRKKLRLTQPDFAQRVGFSLATVPNWEQGRYEPDQAAHSCRVVVEREPDVTKRELQVIAT